MAHMPTARFVALAIVVAVSSFACGYESAAPVVPVVPAVPLVSLVPVVPAIPVVPVVPVVRIVPNLPVPLAIAGTWTGEGADVQGSATFTLTLMQVGDTISGTAVTQGNEADGTCASCHKSTRGTVSGTLRGSTLALTMFFPSGNDGVPTPMCSVRMTANANVTGTAINATYTGDDTCEGPITNGSFSLGNVASVSRR